MSILFITPFRMNGVIDQHDSKPDYHISPFVNPSRNAPCLASHRCHSTGSRECRGEMRCFVLLASCLSILYTFRSFKVICIMPYKQEIVAVASFQAVTKIAMIPTLGKCLSTHKLCAHHIRNSDNYPLRTDRCSGL